MQKLEKAMSVSKDMRWFKQETSGISSAFDAEVHLPPRYMNLPRFRSINQWWRTFN